MGDYKQASDADLVRLSREAEEADLRTYDVLVARHQAWVLANCRYMTRSVEDAEDLAQEIFVKGYYGLERFEGRSSFKSWIKRIKVNHCLNFLRKRKGQIFIESDDEMLQREPAMQIKPDETAGEVIGDERIKSVLEGLPDTLRIPLVLSDLDGLSYDEISRILGIGLSATKMRLKRGRELFRQRFHGPVGVEDRPEDPRA